jgi:hypothetical protein
MLHVYLVISLVPPTTIALHEDLVKPANVVLGCGMQNASVLMVNLQGEVIQPTGRSGYSLPWRCLRRT